MISEDHITLHVDGYVYGGWKEISVRRSMDAAVDIFDLTLTDRWAQEMERRPIRAGAVAEVYLGEEKLITGYVDDVEPDYDADHYSVHVAGRSKVGDLNDCSLPQGIDIQAQHRQRTVAQIAEALTSPFGVSVVDEVGDQSQKTYAITAGETVFEVLAKAARSIAARLMSDADGNLVITRASSERIGTALVLGENILSAKGRISMRDRFSHYYLPGQQPGTDDTHGAAAAHVLGRAQDTRMRYRPTVLEPDFDVTPAQANRLAKWKRNIDYGHSRRITYTVSGWRHADDIWRPNRLVQVNDPRMGVTGSGEDAWLMIGTVRFVLDKRGRRTELSVMPREAFDEIPIPTDATTWDHYATS